MPDDKSSKPGKNYSLYLNAELVEKFEDLQAHLGYGVSQTIGNLIEVRHNEIKDGVTRRQTAQEVKEALYGIRADLAVILELLRQERG